MNEADGRGTAPSVKEKGRRETAFGSERKE